MADPPPPPLANTNTAPVAPNVNVNLLSNNNNTPPTNPVHDYIQRQLTINRLGLGDMVVLQPPDINPVLMRRYAMSIRSPDTSSSSSSESETSATSSSESDHASSRLTKSATSRRRRLNRKPLRKYR